MALAPWKTPAVAKAFETAHLSELDAIPVTETLVWRPVRRRLDVGAFGINAYTAAEPGDEIVEDHTEGTNGHEEVYFVVAGRVEFTLGEGDVRRARRHVRLPRDPDVRRAAIAKEPGSTVLAIGGPRDEKFTPSTWEHRFAAIPFVKAGNYERAKELATGGLAEHPDDAGLLYDLACFEALAGDHDDAVANLTRAAALEPEQVREWAANDTDLDPIRTRPDFPL